MPFPVESHTVVIELPVVVSIRRYPPYRGKREHGVPIEPDEPASVELDGVSPESDVTWQELITYIIEQQIDDGVFFDE